MSKSLAKIEAELKRYQYAVENGEGLEYAESGDNIIQWQALETLIAEYKQMQEAKRTLRKVLEFYADRTLYKNYTLEEPQERIQIDAGHTARKVLGFVEDPAYKNWAEYL